MFPEAAEFAFILPLLHFLLHDSEQLKVNFQNLFLIASLCLFSPSTTLSTGWRLSPCPLREKNVLLDRECPLKDIIQMFET